MHDFPGGPKMFELCSKFCYGMIVTLNAHNVVAARCAAEYLEMTEHVDRGNLVFKIEVFLNCGVLRNWKDSIIVLQNTTASLPWSEELNVVERCIDSIVSKASVDPLNVTWPYTYSKKSVTSNESFPAQWNLQKIPKDWWIEDLCELDIDMYKRVMEAVKSKGRVSSDLIEESIKAYAIRWLPDPCNGLLVDDYNTTKNKILVETLIWLLPSDKSSGLSCQFLLKLLRFVIMIGDGEMLKEELMNRVSAQLYKASAKDLLLPARPPSETTYDVHLVQTLVNRFVMQTQVDCDSRFLEKDGNGMIKQNSDHKKMLRLGELIDGYLAEVASDPNLPVFGFVDLSMSVPKEARSVHDALYAAIDIFLKEHPGLNKSEKKSLCGIMDINKLSKVARIHAIQNERLPLRVVVRVLFEQVAIAHESSRPLISKEDRERQAIEHSNSLKQQPVECECNGEKKGRKFSIKDASAGLFQASRSCRKFDRPSIGEGSAENGKSLETSTSSVSPPASGKTGRAKSCGSSSSWRYSVS